MADFQYKDYVKALGEYQSQAGAQINPLYDMMVKQLQSQGQAQQYASNDMAAARGFGQSGLAVDQQNKIASATQSSIAQANAERASKQADLIRQMQESDRQYGLQRNQFDYGMYNDKRNYDYQVGRDQVADRQWQTQFDYTKGQDTIKNNQWNQQFNYQSGRDKVADSQWAQEFALRKKAGSGGGGGGSSRSSYSSAPQTKTNSNPVNQVPEWFIKNYNNAKKNGTTIGMGTLPGTKGYANKMSNLIY